ncbi:MAG: type I polyketide synthase, partial [Deltaproteobacteria bacterium]|nr:type I polyketide synthase [Deltaproteobacteria bacterium]
MKRIDENTKVTPTVTARDAIAVIGAGAIMPSSPDVASFWDNVREGRYLIREVPEDRWCVDSYYDPDPSVPDKTYSKLGSFVEGFDFDFKHFRIPPRTVQAMDLVQLWAMAAAGEALENAGYIDRDFDRERTGVILGNSMAGELHYATSMRVMLPEVVTALEMEPHFLDLPAATKKSIIEGLRARIAERLPAVTEDTMPGELSNVISGRVANSFNLGGANYTVDAACASSLAALNTSINGLRRGEYDMVVTGGVDRSMSPPMYVKFCKIGALSATGSYPFDARASGFVMGEGCAVFVLKRLVDAVNDGDNILSMVLGIGSSSDGKGKGIAAPNKTGQLRALRRAYEDSGIRPDEIDAIEAHGTATKVGDPMEAEALSDFFDVQTIGTGRIALGSVKSQFGHLKSAAGAAAVLKMTMALHHKILPPSVNYETPNPAIPFDRMAVRVQTSADEWKNGARPRRAGISAFGFGGTNFHVVMQEAPGDEFWDKATTIPASSASRSSGDAGEEKKTMTSEASVINDILERVAFMWAETPDDLLDRLRAGERPARLNDLEEVRSFCARPCRLAMAIKSDEEIEAKSAKLVEGMKDGFDPSRMKLFEKQGVHVGTGTAMKVAYLFPGQGSQSVGMLKDLYDRYPTFRAAFDKADAVMSPILGHSITDIVYGDASDKEKKAKLDERLKQTEVTQPAMLTVDAALMGVLAEAGIEPDMVVGHSLGEYAALVAAGVLDLDAALEIVAAR